MAKRGRKPKFYDEIKDWIKSDPLFINRIQDTRISEVYDKYFLPWSEENKIKVEVPSFYACVKRFLSDNKLENEYENKTNDVRGLKVKTVQDERTNEQKKWEEIQGAGYKDVFEQLRATAEGVCKGYFSGALVYGGPGVGKSHIVREVVQKEADKYQIFKGSIKGTQELVYILNKYKSGYTLVFDDFDHAWRSPANREIVLSALDDRKEREISWVDYKQLNRKQNRVPIKFTFESGIIIITNRDSVELAVKSRTLVVPVFLNKEEMVDRISAKLKEFMPKIPVGLKQEVLEFFLKEYKDLHRVDFRQFKYAVGYKLLNPTSDKWKIWTRRMLNS